MTWTPSAFLLEGELDNRTPGKITGWLRFAGLAEQITLDLEGDFEPDIRGRKIGLKGVYFGKEAAAIEYMKGLTARQVGKAGHITAGWPPQSWTDYPYIEWYSATNDRVVLFPEPHQVSILDPAVDLMAKDPGLV